MPSFVLAYLVNGEDVWMIKSRRRLRFLYEPLEQVLLLAELLVEKLQCDLPVELRITGQKTSPIPPDPMGETIS